MKEYIRTTGIYRMVWYNRIGSFIDQGSAHSKEYYYVFRYKDTRTAEKYIWFIPESFRVGESISRNVFDDYYKLKFKAGQIDYVYEEGEYIMLDPNNSLFKEYCISYNSKILNTLFL